MRTHGKDAEVARLQALVGEAEVIAGAKDAEIARLQQEAALLAAGHYIHSLRTGVVLGIMGR